MQDYPQNFGSFVLLKKIGEGELSEVFQARAPQWADQVVAIKRIKKEFVHDREFVGLLESEAHSVSQLRHPNLIFLYCFSKEADFSFMVMEYVDSQSLNAIYQQCLKQGELPPPPASCFIVKEAASALHYLHTSSSMLHTDLAPRNILIGKNGEVKLIDFSFAQTQLNRAQVGKPTSWVALGDISPEMARGEGLDERSDVFQLGLILFKLLSGCSPFGEKASYELHEAIKIFNIDSIPLPTQDKGLAEILRLSLANHPKDRYASAQAMERVLTKYLNIHYPDYGPLDLARWMTR